MKNSESCVVNQKEIDYSLTKKRKSDLGFKNPILDFGTVKEYKVVIKGAKKALFIFSFWPSTITPGLLC